MSVGILGRLALNGWCAAANLSVATSGSLLAGRFHVLFALLCGVNALCELATP